MERYGREESGKHARILIAAAQKSGSTFFSQILSRLTGLPNHHISDAYKGGEHELSVDRLKSLAGERFIALVHTRCSMGTAQRIAEFELRTIFTVRNIFDTVVSLRDHIRNTDWNLPAFASPVIMAICPARLKDASDRARHEMLVALMVP